MVVKVVLAIGVLVVLPIAIAAWEVHRSVPVLDADGVAGRATPLLAGAPQHVLTLTRWAAKRRAGRAAPGSSSPRRGRYLQ